MAKSSSFKRTLDALAGVRTLVGAGVPVSWPERRGGEAARSTVFLIWGPNPSFDYYFAPRLEGASPGTFTVLDSRAAPPAIDWQGVHLVICRYLPSRWRKLVEAVAPRLGGVTLFLDDDFPAVIRDASVPLSYRYRLWRDGLSQWPFLKALGAGLVVSTPALAARFSPQARVLPPVPGNVDLASEPLGPCEGGAVPLIFHATAAHRREHAFMAEVALQLQTHVPAARFDVVAQPDITRLWQNVPGTTLRPPVGWEAYRAMARTLRDGILLAPLADSAANRPRSRTKAIDACRFGSAALFSDLPPYADLEGIGPRLPFDAGRWAAEIAVLLNDPALRMQRRDALRARVGNWRQEARWPEDWPELRP